MPTMLRSGLCTQAQLESPSFRAWCQRLGLPHGLHRKLWEHAFICQALQERDLLRPGCRGLGFGVGREPLAALFASEGCEIVATDLAPEAADRLGWIEGQQHAACLEALNAAGLCPADRFARLASFRFVDMNAIPKDLTGFDLCWSACSFEHVGSISLGLRFVDRMLDCLRPGGWAVHTTEFNVSSNEATLDNGPTVLFRRRDLVGLADRLSRLGHKIELDLDPGSGWADGFIDAPPYSHNPHLKLRLAEYVTTSVGLIIEKGPDRLSLRLRRAFGLRKGA
ncbi:hypothetical protein BH23PLA1_BH23PLA1_06130 [soil metagenome]